MPHSNSISDPPGTQTPEYRLVKFLTGLVFVSGFFIGIVGLMIVHELKAVTSSREVIQADYVEQQDRLSKRIDDLSAKVEMLLLKGAAERKDP